jgi:hypothetical protein
MLLLGKMRAKAEIFRKVFLKKTEKRPQSRMAQGFQLFVTVVFIFFEGLDVLITGGHGCRKGVQSCRKVPKVTIS